MGRISHSSPSIPVAWRRKTLIRSHNSGTQLEELDDFLRFISMIQTTIRAPRIVQEHMRLLLVNGFYSSIAITNTQFLSERCWILGKFVVLRWDRKHPLNVFRKLTHQIIINGIHTSKDGFLQLPFFSTFVSNILAVYAFRALLRSCGSQFHRPECIGPPLSQWGHI